MMLALLLVLLLLAKVPVLTPSLQLNLRTRLRAARGGWWPCPKRYIHIQYKDPSLSVWIP